ncbi:twin-arginine translocase TatA/TatE family subunit [Streptomyces sp. NPDC051771]|uniref:twin-arginine translocase TatA/TatE family subunit n=1 Tax=Streptomyces sp. NPDC051771 TaxID=3154847 RepID=UPI003420069B
MFGLSEIAILLVVVALVVGARKLPELARNAGKAARILKAEAREMKADGTRREPTVTYTVKANPAPAAGAPAAGAPAADEKH